MKKQKSLRSDNRKRKNVERDGDTIGNNKRVSSPGKKREKTDHRSNDKGYIDVVA